MATHWTDKMPKWFWKLPLVWRFKYEFYHEQFLPPAPPKPEKTLPYVKYDVQEDGDIVWNPYAGPHFRCPHCGQGHELLFTYEAEDLRLRQNELLTTVYLMRVRNGKAERFEQDSPEFTHYVSRMWNKMEIPCHRCKHTAPKWRWTHAHANPLLYFETENICHCGGEMYFQSDAIGNHYLMCEKCDWVKPGSGISGAERMD